MLKVLVRVFSSSFVFLILISCSLNKENKARKNQNMVGEFTLQQLQKSTHQTWFNEEFKSYSVDKESLAYLINNPESIKNISVKLFLGTWCSDSHREVPRFIKVLNYLGINDYQLIGLDTNKKSPLKTEQNFDIHYVPTFVIYQNEKELNRIIETPVKTFEKDLIDILKVKNYSPNYR